MNRPFNLLDYSIAFSTPRRITDVASWHLHIPFAFVIMAMLKPKQFVELGTHKGDSYCAFCQAVEELSLNTTCHAVDSWQGDEHAGFYGAEVLEELRAYHDPLYSGFSSLLKCLFDDALEYFPEGSIDLLHIDGHHTYDSLRHDFESWLSRMSKRGIMLFHDTNVRERKFGVWQMWNEISSQYPGFEFKFGNGLGILAVGGQMGEDVRAFLEYGKEHETVLSRFFYHLGTKIELDLQKDTLSKQVYQLENTLLVRDKEAEERLRRNAAIIEEKDRQLRDLQAAQDRQLKEIVTLLEEKNLQLDEIHASKGWRWLTRYRKMKAFFAF
ncbi:MAG: class I SAM-dependent methyltransferase [Desulfobacteraceae bacterium]|nr:MAG: class I SAM-dependent methyltransferase [Desulfobacteraceae bacterium]